MDGIDGIDEMNGIGMDGIGMDRIGMDGIRVDGMEVEMGRELIPPDSSMRNSSSSEGR